MTLSMEVWVTMCSRAVLAMILWLVIPELILVTRSSMHRLRSSERKSHLPHWESIEPVRLMR